jgi:hypothetical protein
MKTLIFFFSFIIITISCDSTKEKNTSVDLVNTKNQNNENEEPSRIKSSNNNQNNDRNLTTGEKKLLASIQHNFGDSFFLNNIDKCLRLSDLPEGVSIIEERYDGMGEIQVVQTWAHGSNKYYISRWEGGFITIITTMILNGADGSVNISKSVQIDKSEIFSKDVNS